MGKEKIIVARSYDSSSEGGLEHQGVEVSIGLLGDYVIADRDGTVIIPGKLADEVTLKTDKVLKTENLVRTAILNGTDPQNAYLKYEKF